VRWQTVAGVPFAEAGIFPVNSLARGQPTSVIQIDRPPVFHPAPILLVLALWLGCSATAAAQPADLAAAYLERVVQRLVVPPEEVVRYAELTLIQLEHSGVTLTASQYVAVVDRSPHVQAILVYWFALGQTASLVGASPVSTGRVGQFDHFETPLGVFDHAISNPDFRAEGTRNAMGFRGYGAKGMRVYDLGWQQATRGWGKGGASIMRLQMHATDPVLAELKLGSVQSKGCIRIPATLNRLLDHFGVLDADYATSATDEPPPWVLPRDRQPIADAGRYLVVVDSLREARPPWSPAPQ